MFTTCGYFRGVNCPFYIQGRGMCRRPYCHFRHVRSSAESFDATSSTTVGSVAGNGCSYVATPLASCPKETIRADKTSNVQYKATPISKENTTEYSYKATPLYGHFGSIDPKLELPITEDSSTKSDIIQDNKPLNKQYSLPDTGNNIYDNVTNSKRYSQDSLLLNDDTDDEYDPTVISRTFENEKTNFVYHATKKEDTNFISTASSSDNEQTYHPIKIYSTDIVIMKEDITQKREIETNDSVLNKKFKRNDTIESEITVKIDDDDAKNEEDHESISLYNDVFNDLQCSSDENAGELKIVLSDDNPDNKNAEEEVETKLKISEEKLAEFFLKIKSAKTSTKKIKTKSFSEMISKKHNLENKINIEVNHTITNENDDIKILKKENDSEIINDSIIGDLKKQTTKKSSKIYDTELKPKKLEVKDKTIGKDFQQTPELNKSKSKKRKSGSKLKLDKITKSSVSKSERNLSTQGTPIKHESKEKSMELKKNEEVIDLTISSDEQDKEKSEKITNTKKIDDQLISQMENVDSLSSSCEEGKTTLVVESNKLGNSGKKDVLFSESNKQPGIKPAKKVILSKSSSSKGDIFSLSSSNEEPGKIPERQPFKKVNSKISSKGDILLSSSNEKKKIKHGKKVIPSKSSSKNDVFSLSSSSSDETAVRFGKKPGKKVCPIESSSKTNVLSLSSNNEENRNMPKITKRKISIELFGEDSDEEENGNIFKKIKVESSKKAVNEIHKCLDGSGDNSRASKKDSKPLGEQLVKTNSKICGKTKTNLKNISETNKITGTDSDASFDDDVSLNDLTSDIPSDLTDFETDTYEECLKIFNEETTVKTEEVPVGKMGTEDEFVDTVRTGRKRLAHVSKHGEAVRRQIQRRVAGPSPAQVCHNRYLKLQEMFAKRTEDSAHLKPSLDKRRQAHLPKVVPNTSTQKVQKSTTAKPQPTSSNTQIGNSKSVGKRIAHSTPSKSTNSVGKRIVHSTPSKSTNSVGKGIAHSTPSKSTNSGEWVTIAGTADKGSKRVAHVPKTKASKRPLVPVEYGKHIPNVVRQRYLSMFIDELLKVGVEEQTAFDMALEEEKVACDKASSKNVYLNVCINTVKRIRSMDCRNSKCNLRTTSRKKSVSHLANIGGKLAAQTSFSFQEKVIEDHSKLRGLELYNKLKKYIMTEQELKDNGYPRSDPDNSRKVIVYKEQKKNLKSSDPNNNICARCGKAFLRRPDGHYITREECLYHWGKLWKRKVAGNWECRYTCCAGDGEATGCCVGKFHVTDDKCGSFEGFMKTIAKSPPRNTSPGVFAVDCEMCYTKKGLELTRVTVIGESMEKVYDSLVKPANPVIDHNSRFSGITEDDMKSVTTTIRDVQAVLLSLFSAETILLGHSLESDLLALKLIHSTVVDTSVVFPHRRGPPFKKALKTLMADCLNKIIQNNIDGHDSTEDAKSCLELMLWKIREDAKIKAHS